jgi:hypothetical protein
MAMRTVPTSNPTTVADFQGCVCPPYCNARVKHTINDIIRHAPTRSSCRSFSLVVASVDLAFFGTLKKKKTTTAATPPIGRLTARNLAWFSSNGIGRRGSAGLESEVAFVSPLFRRMLRHHSVSLGT